MTSKSQHFIINKNILIKIAQINSYYNNINKINS